MIKKMYYKYFKIVRWVCIKIVQWVCIKIVQWVCIKIVQWLLTTKECRYWHYCCLFLTKDSID